MRQDITSGQRPNQAYTRTGFNTSAGTMEMPSTYNVSVIIPTYNRAKYICEAVDSVLAQTRPLDEIIVIDDGSTDNTEEVLTPYRSKIRYIKQLNGGPAAARNLGMKEASGDYIAFLDSDDVWLPKKTQIQIDMFNLHPHLDIVFGEMANFTGDKVNYSCEPKNPILHDYFASHSSNIEGILDCLIIENTIPTPTVMLKRGCISRIGFFDEELKIAEDFDYWLRAARCCAFGFVDAVLVQRRRHEGNLINDWETRMRSHVVVLERFRETSQNLPIHTIRLLDQHLDQTHYDLGSLFFKKRDFANAWAHFSRGFPNKMVNGKWCIKIVVSFAVSKLYRSSSLSREHRVNERNC